MFALFTSGFSFIDSHSTGTSQYAKLYGFSAAGMRTIHVYGECQNPRAPYADVNDLGRVKNVKSRQLLDSLQGAGQ